MKQIKDFSEKLTVLVIEDNHGDFVLIEEYLNEKFEHITVIHFTDFTDSVNYLQNSKDEVSLILLDLHLPGINGMELINKVLNYHFKIPIVVLTGYSDLGLAKSSLQLGIYDYLIKDEINPAILHKTICFSMNRSDFIHQIETEKNNYENLFNFNPQPTWLLDSETLKILNANIAAQKKYGFYLEDFQNMIFTQLHPDEEEFLVVKNFKAKENRSINNYFTHYLSNGSEVKVDIHFKEFQYGSNNRLIVQSNDISERVNQLRIIEMQNSILRNIAWTQSNLLKAPISRVLEIINLMEEQPENLDKVSYWLTELKKSTNEMDEVVKKVIEETNQNK